MARVGGRARGAGPLARASRRLRALGRGAENAWEILARGRLGAPYRAPFEVELLEGVLSLRHYVGPPTEQPAGDALLLVPPLMVTADVYDISPELSAVASLAAQGVDVWVVDFGAPEHSEGGMDRTLDDHVLAVDRAITEVAARTGGGVHVAGYSQGGMFAYQAAALRHGRDIASVITLGSPVDMRRNLPFRLDDTLAERFFSALGLGLAGALERIEGLPGTITSTGFKLLSPRQELKHLFGTLGVLHDREALERIEPRRRFLGGEGFIGWPGPAFRDFVGQFIVQNRMRSGGFVIDGRTVSLADLRCPILYFVGTRDDMARPGAVRAIERAAPHAETHSVAVEAGHFGLVVGSRALTLTWPTVAQWIRWRADRGPMPLAIAEGAGPGGEPPEVAPDGPDSPALDLLLRAGEAVWRGLGEASLAASGLASAARWQLPRVIRLLGLADHSRVSIARLLSEQARAIPDETFFLWEGRAYTYEQADRRVNQLARVLWDLGIGRGRHVAVFMGNHPDYLTAVAALNRLGAVAVLLNADARGASLAHAMVAGSVDVLLCDAEHGEAALEAAGARPVWVLGAAQAQRAVPSGATDLDPQMVHSSGEPPDGLDVDAGIARDLALLLFTSGTTGLPKAARITNMRQVAAALWAASLCELTPRNTVYCALPLHHATGILVACGAALVGGSRLALAPRFSASGFWDDVRRYGVDVVVYVGELCRYLVSAPGRPDEADHPVRLFVGNGMRAEVWEHLLARFGPVRVMEFYGSTEGNVVLANVSGQKIGSVGQPLTGAGEVAVLRWDLDAEAPARDAEGRAVRAAPGEAGLLVSRIDSEHPLARFEGYVDPDTTARRVMRDLFEPGDAWFDTGDLMRRDADGDFWFVDRLGETFRWKGENVSSAQVAAVVAEASFVSMATVYGVALTGREGRAGMAAVELLPGASFDGEALYRLVAKNLTPAARPRFVRVVPKLETTASLKVDKSTLRAEGADPGRVGDPLYHLDEPSETYAPLTMNGWAQLVARPATRL
ncbi:MAG: long-chain-acyl-CoA synthetase [Deltaproteobacteria bacterium]|nr:long-chain-acyl-CoA synthetase [Deltaproteobacteria bacterium]